MPAPPLPNLPPISVAMTGLDPGAIGLSGLSAGERVRGVLAWLARAGVRGVQVDATMQGIRPRELDRSGRRDLAALLRRDGVAFSGVDMFIPPADFLSPAASDRATSAVLMAIELAADLAALTGPPSVSSVSLTLPDKTPADIRVAIADRAALRGARVADHAWPIPGVADGQAAASQTSERIGAGLDPATALTAGEDPVTLAARLGKRLAGARLSDVARAPGIGRVPPGKGRLDVPAYLVTLATVGYRGHAVLDPAGLRDPGQIIKSVNALVAAPF